VTEVEEIKCGHVAWQYWPLLISKVPANSRTSEYNKNAGMYKERELVTYLYPVTLQTKAILDSLQPSASFHTLQDIRSC